MASNSDYQSYNSSSSAVSLFRSTNSRLEELESTDISLRKNNNKTTINDIITKKIKKIEAVSTDNPYATNKKVLNSLNYKEDIKIGSNNYNNTYEEVLINQENIKRFGIYTKDFIYNKSTSTNTISSFESIDRYKYEIGDKLIIEHQSFITSKNIYTEVSNIIGNIIYLSNDIEMMAHSYINIILIKNSVDDVKRNIDNISSNKLTVDYIELDLTTYNQLNPQEGDILLSNTNIHSEFGKRNSIYEVYANYIINDNQVTGVGTADSFNYFSSYRKDENIESTGFIKISNNMNTDIIRTKNNQGSYIDLYNGGLYNQSSINDHSFYFPEDQSFNSIVIDAGTLEFSKSNLESILGESLDVDDWIMFVMEFKLSEMSFKNDTILSLYPTTERIIGFNNPQRLILRINSIVGDVITLDYPVQNAGTYYIRKVKIDINTYANYDSDYIYLMNKTYIKHIMQNVDVNGSTNKGMILSNSMLINFDTSTSNGDIIKKERR